MDTKDTVTKIEKPEVTKLHIGPVYGPKVEFDNVNYGVIVYGE